MPSPYGHAAAIDSMGAVAAPLLAGFSDAAFDEPADTVDEAFDEPAEPTIGERLAELQRQVSQLSEQLTRAPARQDA